MQPDYKPYLSDILNAVGKIERYTSGLSFEDFLKNELVADGVNRNLEIIGESVKKLPAAFCQAHPQIEWRKIAGLRDILIHSYAGINQEMIWQVVQEKLPALKNFITTIIDQ